MTMRSHIVCRRLRISPLWTIATLACICFASRAARAGFPQCPNIGYSQGCAILIDIQPNGLLKVRTDPTVPPYDNIEDTLVGVINHSGATVFGISLQGPDIFGFDGDGAGDPTGGFWAAGSPYGAYPGGPFGPTQYEGPDTSFSRNDANSGIVNFPKGLNNNDSLWFSLEGAPSQIKFARTVTVDPGHGSTCASVRQPVGAIGTTDFPPSSPPPGKLLEDNLAVAISLSLKDILQSAGYTVVMTKTSPVSCPTFLERGTIANKARSNFFVSVHLNAPRLCPLGLLCGTEVLYNSVKTDSATLAQLMAPQIAANLGVSNRGAVARDDLAVLKTTRTRMAAVIAEVARLSPPDDAIIHDPASLPKAAKGIFLGIEDFINR